MNNQDFKKLLRESIEARKEKELEEGKIGDFFNKIMSGVKGSEKSSPLDVTANYIKNRLIDGYKKTGQDDKAEDSNLIDQLTKRFLASAKTTIEDSPNVNSENLIKTLKDMVDAVTGIKDEEGSEDPDSEDEKSGKRDDIEKGDSFTYTSKKGNESAIQVVDPENEHGATIAQRIDPKTCDPKKNSEFATNAEKFAASAEDPSTPPVGEPIEKCSIDDNDPNANASDDFLDPKVNAKSIATEIIVWSRGQIYKLNKSNPRKESIKLVQSLNIILKKGDPEAFKQFLAKTFEEQRDKNSSNAWIVNKPKNLDRLSLDNFKKIMEALLKNPKMKPIFNAVEALKESKKNTLQPRLHESLRRERDEEIYNKLMKRLNNQ